MDRERKTASNIFISIFAAVLYPLFLILSTLFVVPYSLIQQMFAVRADADASRRTRMVHRARWFVFIDVVATILTYLSADIVRCQFWIQREWPEVVPTYGSTFDIHMMMLGALVFAWPSILYWLGWYRPRHRTIVWRTKNTVAAAIMLAFFMSTVALLGFREIYPRTQIGFTILLLPLVTAIIRTVIEVVERGAMSRKRNSHPDPAW